MAEMSDLGQELITIMKDGLKAQGWLDAAQVTELMLKNNADLADAGGELDDSKEREKKLRLLLGDTYNTLMEAHNHGSLSAHGCAEVASRIEDGLKEINGT